MFYAVRFCLGLMLAGLPLAVSADVTPPAPAPVASDAAKPTPAPREHFVTVDGAITGKTYNELAPGTSTGGWGIRAAAEVPVIGHNWMAQVDYRSYSYQPQGARRAYPTASRSRARPATRAASRRSATRRSTPRSVPDRSTTSTRSARTTRRRRSASVRRSPRSSATTSASATSSAVRAIWGIRPRAAWASASTSCRTSIARFRSTGTSGCSSTSTVHTTRRTTRCWAGFPGYPFTVAYHMFAYRLGVTYAIPKTPVFLDLSDVGDQADVTANAPSAAGHNALFMGAGLRFYGPTSRAPRSANWPRPALDRYTWPRCRSAAGASSVRG